MPYSAGGPGDTLSRIVGQGLTKVFGKQFIIENAAGAGGTIGSAKVANAKPDGHNPADDPHQPRHQPRALFEAHLRSGQELRADRHRGRPADGVRGQEGLSRRLLLGSGVVGLGSAPGGHLV